MEEDRAAGVRRYGVPPFGIAVLHGGPGAPGSAAPIARELGRDAGVLEPLQSASTVEGQLAELHEQLAVHAQPPVALIGWSWGALLAYMFAARHPSVVGKLILVSSAVFDSAAAAQIVPTLEARLTRPQRERLAHLHAVLEDGAAGEACDEALRELAAIHRGAEILDPIEAIGDETIAVQHDVHRRVWGEAVALRDSGTLLAAGRAITCPVVALHGDYDPRPAAAGVRDPLQRVLRRFTFVLLASCGHYPWLERRARDSFFSRLREHLRRG